MLNRLKNDFLELLGKEDGFVYNDKYGDSVGKGEKDPVFKDGEYGDGAGEKSYDAKFKTGEYGHDAGLWSHRPVFEKGLYGDCAGLEAERPVFKGGGFGEMAAVEAEKPVFLGGEFEDGVGAHSRDPLVISGIFESDAFEGAENIRAYIRRKCVWGTMKPRSGRVVMEEEPEKVFDYDIPPEELFIYTTKENIDEMYKENSAYIPQEKLDEIKEETIYRIDVDETEYEFMDLIMDEFLNRVDEKAEYFEGDEGYV